MTAEVDANDVSGVARRVLSHYVRPNLMADVLAGLRFAGKDPACLSPDDLSPLDEFHVRGREATLELARAAGIDGTMSVLDAGSGIGGPSRRLAQELGCRVLVWSPAADRTVPANPTIEAMALAVADLGRRVAPEAISLS